MQPERFSKFKLIERPPHTPIEHLRQRQQNSQSRSGAKFIDRLRDRIFKQHHKTTPSKALRRRRILSHRDPGPILERQYGDLCRRPPFVTHGHNLVKYRDKRTTIRKQNQSQIDIAS
jgi:hypothetical protein